MAQRAKSVIDVILGEAKAGDMRDMLGIASVIKNRSDALGKPPQSVVSVRSEFNAYGQRMPAGVERFRELAEQAWNHVNTVGPVHNATFYATPSATRNLPNGLEPVDRTNGHVYFSDPYNRSIRTAEGFARPNVVQDLPTQYVNGIDVIDMTNDIPYGVTASRNAQPFQGAVIHHSEPDRLSSLRSVTNNPRADLGGAFLGYHFGVDPAGNIGQLAPLDMRTNHIGKVGSSNPNLTNANSLSISLLDASNPFTERQAAQAGEIIAAVNRAGNLGFIDPRTDIAYHGKGSTNSRPVEGQAEVAAIQNYLQDLPFGPNNTPVPTSRPTLQQEMATGIMSAIDPVTTTPVERGVLGPVAQSAPIAPGPVEYGGLLGPPSIPGAMPTAEVAKSGRVGSAPGFDMGRFGPAKSAVPETPVAAFAPSPPPVDPDRFGQPQPATVMDRMGTVGPVAQGMAGLQRGLLDQQLAAGILPELPKPVEVAALGPVSAQPQFKAPVIEEVPQPPAPQVAGPASVQPQISAPVPTLSPAQQTFNQRSALGAPAPSLLGPQMARDVQRQMGARSMIGGIGGALLGGALLGPIGGLLGGLAGRTYANRTYHPPAPEPVKGQPQQTFTKGESSYGNLNDYGQQAYSDSGQFAAAVDSGMAGLW